MLTRKCLSNLELLLGENLFNVRLTTVPKLSRFTQKSYEEGRWKEFMRDSIGGTLNTTNPYAVKYTIVVNGEPKTHFAKVSGKEIINHFWHIIKDADGVRFDVTNEKNTILTWIIVKE